MLLDILIIGFVIMIGIITVIRGLLRKDKIMIILGSFIFILVGISFLLTIAIMSHEDHQQNQVKINQQRYDQLIPKVNRVQTDLVYVTHQLKITTDNQTAKQLSQRKVSLTNQLHALQAKQQLLARSVWRNESTHQPDIWYQRGYPHGHGTIIW